MKNIFRISGVILLILSFFLIHSCKKQEELPVITTTAVSNITATTATSGGNITDEGSSTVTSRGICWSTGATPTTTDSKTTDGAGSGTFTSSISGLNSASTYFVRAYATNSVGTGYGIAVLLKTMGQSPVATSSSPSNINTTGATLNGTVNANYLSTEVTFEYGISINYGSSITDTQSPVTGNTVTSVSATVTGLKAGTTYHFRVKAVNSLGTTYSSDLTFTTLGQAPIVLTQPASNVSASSATLHGTVNANSLSTIVLFEYGLTSSYGSTITATQSPITGVTATNINANLNSLSAGTTYHYRIKAVNDLGTTNGADVTFTTFGFVADIDGNIYNTIAIGSQIWMKENLRTTKYNDGTSIPLVTNSTEWASITLGYCWYNNDPANYKSTYGALYNFLAVCSIYNGGKNICPTGWHVPSYDEWVTLALYLDPNAIQFYNTISSVAGGKLKESGTDHWQSPNFGATNETGFTALPGGYHSM